MFATLAQVPGGEIGTIILIAGGLLAMLFFFFLIYAARYVKVGPNEVLIVSGRQHTVVDGSGREKRVAALVDPLAPGLVAHT